MGETHQQRIRKVVDNIVTNYIAEIPRDIYNPERRIESLLDSDGKFRNASLSGIEKRSLIPITTSMLVLNSIMGNNTLIEGASGTAKTELASVIGCILYQLPYEFMKTNKVVGTPGATVNEIFATHDLGELNKGNDVAFLYLKIHSPYLFIDELNRFSEIEQNRIREGISSKVWTYANHSWPMKNQITVSAVNPDSYGGTFFLNENLLDNYSLVLEPAMYNPLFHANLVRNAEAKIKRDLGLEGAINELLAYYEKNKNSSESINTKICELQKTMQKELEKRSIPILFNGHIDEIKKEIEQLKFDPEGTMFFYSVLAEMTYSRQFGRIRYDDSMPGSEGTHDKKYITSMIKEGLHGRFLKAWTDTSKVIAWYMGKSKVEIEDIKAAFIYVAPKRIKPYEGFRQQVLQDARNLPINFEIARQLITVAWDNYTDFKGKPKDKKKEENNEAYNMIRKAIRIVSGDTSADLKDAIKILTQVDHPLAREVLEYIALDAYFNPTKK